MNIAVLNPIKNPAHRVVSVPGSKSLTNRALIIAALSPRLVTVVNPLVADDTLAMAGCLTNLGIAVSQRKDRWIVHSGIHPAKSRKHILNARLSGTTLRFILPLAAITPGVTVLGGEPGLNARPIAPLVEALRGCGASIEFLKENGHPPISIRGSTLRPGTIRIQGNISSQFVSALLMTLPAIGASKLVMIEQPVSTAFIRMTTDLMEKCGVPTQPHGKTISIQHRNYDADNIIIEPDVSSACYFAAIAVLSHSAITVRAIKADSTQPDMQFLRILGLMSNSITQTRLGITIRGSGVRPVTVDMTNCPDQIQTLAVLAAFAKGKTVIHGIQTLRMKETDRVCAIQTELSRMHIRTKVTQKTLTIWGGTPRACCIKTYGDHRMAMAFAVAGSVLPRLQIEQPQVITKTFPGFWDALSAIGIAVRKEHI